MSRSRHPLTPAVEQSIVAYIRAGGFSHVAAEAAGIPHKVFERWCRQGEGPRAPPRLRAFALAVRQAIAQARLGAEVAVREDKPLDWLRHGPGRETPQRSGWTSAARPRPPAAATPPVLTDAAVQSLLTNLLELLEPFSEARATVAAFFASAGK